MRRCHDFDFIDKWQTGCCFIENGTFVFFRIFKRIQVIKGSLPQITCPRIETLFSRYLSQLYFYFGSKFSTVTNHRPANCSGEKFFKGFVRDLLAQRCFILYNCSSICRYIKNRQFMSFLKQMCGLKMEYSISKCGPDPCSISLANI